MQVDPTVSDSSCVKAGAEHVGVDGGAVVINGDANVVVDDEGLDGTTPGNCTSVDQGPIQREGAASTEDTGVSFGAEISGARVTHGELQKAWPYP